MVEVRVGVGAGRGGGFEGGWDEKEGRGGEEERSCSFLSNLQRSHMV